MENVRIIFVLSDECSDESDTPEIMLQAFEECKQNVENVMWTKNSDLMNITFSKTDYVVFERFTDESFETLKQSKCARILGPWAIRICLMEQKPIPTYSWPIYNVAMYKYVVTCSGLSKEHKRMVTEKVELMGGRCENAVVNDTTHVVVDKAKTEKYFVAGENGIKLMKSTWIEEVWRASQTVNIDANDTRFDSHRCRSFEGLTISTTGMTAAERCKAEHLVKQNGGKFTGQLVIANTDILCCGANATTSEKYKAARQAGISCVTNTWLTDSVTKGYAQRPTQYTVQKCTSTPTKSGRMSNPEYSVLSAIGQPDFSPRPSVEDTFVSSRSNATRTGSTKRKASLKDEYSQMVNSLDIKKAKLAGQYLDGCSVYITGFTSDHVEKLNKILNFSGATRNDKISDRITHVIVGDPSFHEVNIIRNKYSSCALVSVKWLLDSIEQERPVNEENYLIRNTDFDKSCMGSPLSKKGLSLLRSNRTVTEKDVAEESINVPYVPDKGDDIVRQYLKPNIPAEDDTIAKFLQNMEETDFSKSAARDLSKDFQPQSTSTQQTSMSVTQDKSSEISEIFENFKFLVVEGDDYEQIKVMIEDKNGQVVPKNFKGVPDYSVCPIFVDHNFSCSTAAESVNKLFIYDCCQQDELITNIVYYHRPFSKPTNKPLVNCVITISTYGGAERMFLNALIEILGGVAQEQFARIKDEAKGCLVSTHLVSPEPKGKKYERALKWGLPVVSGDWLMDCLQTGERVSEEKYLLGDSVAPKRMDDESATNNSIVEELTKRMSASTSHPGESKVATPVNKNMSTSTTCNAGVSNVATPVNKIFEADVTSSKSQIPIDPKTPVYQRFFDNTSRQSFSPVTPVNKILRNFNENTENYSGQKDSKEYSLPKRWMNIKTPETPLGAFLTPNPSPNLRKQWEYWLQQFPDKSVTQSQASTPLSEIKQRIWDNILRRDRISQPNFNDSANENDEQADMNPPSEDSNPKTPVNHHLVNKLQQLEDMLTASGGAKRTSRNFQSIIPAPGCNQDYQNSQPGTVGWDFRQGETPKQKMFSISGVDSEARNNMVSQIEQLGGLVSELSSYDPSCTHLLCSKPGRNEKTLSCMAAGKWILHISYLEKSLEAGEFLDEEEYEFGNPKSVGKFPVGNDSETERRMNRMHWWHKEISRRGYGAFNDMRAIIVAQKMEPIARVIEAGGGVVIDVKPPFEDTVHATHCLLEQKNVIDFNDYIPLAEQGIFVLGTVYISDYLHDPTKDIRDCILPYFTKYYSRL